MQGAPCRVAIFDPQTALRMLVQYLDVVIT